MRILAAATIVAGSLFGLHAAGIAQMTRANSPESEGRRICRYVDETGKLAARRRVCLTRAEWNRVAEEQRKSSETAFRAVESCGARAEGGGTIAIGVNQGGGANTFTNGGGC